MILILTMHSDPTADPVERLLRERGADVVRFDPGDFPERAACSMRFQRATGWQRTLERRGERPIDLDEVSAVWLRRPGARTAPAAITDEHARNYLLAERTAVVADHVTTDGASRRLPKLPGRIFPAIRTHACAAARPKTASAPFMAYASVSLVFVRRDGRFGELAPTGSDVLGCAQLTKSIGNQPIRRLEIWEGQ